MSEKRSIFQDVGSDAKQEAVQTGMIDRFDAGGRRSVYYWLLGLMALIVVMIVVGGLTRLTDSGLSITEWDPVMGAIPPLSAADWAAAFEAYKTTAEFQTQNLLMEMSEFKTIFWWEWGHRQLGRFIGVYWLVGFLYLLLRGFIPGSRRLAVFLIGPFIGVQGLLGWLMVNSGLDGVRVDVAAYWLMFHLGAAFALLAYVYWQTMTFARTEADLLQARRNRDKRPFGLGTGLMHFAYLQILVGALVAGLDAGRNYTDWPLMAGGVFPPGFWEFTPWYTNLWENDGTVQFFHRIIAYALFAYGLIVGSKARKSAFKAVRSAFGTVGLLLILQVVLGIVTVMNGAPLVLAIGHQFLGILLWIAILRARFVAGFPPAQSVRDA